MVLIVGVLLDFESVQVLQLLPCKCVGNLLILSGTVFVYILGSIVLETLQISFAGGVCSVRVRVRTLNVSYLEVNQ